MFISPIFSAGPAGPQAAGAGPACTGWSCGRGNEGTYGWCWLLPRAAVVMVGTVCAGAGWGGEETTKPLLGWDG